MKGCFGFQNQMDYVKTAVKGLELTVKSSVDTLVHRDAAGQQSCIEISRPFLMCPQIKTHRHCPLIQTEVSLCIINVILNYNTCSVQFRHSVVSDSLRPHGLQHARLPCPSPTTGACSNSCSSSWWCHPAISSSVAPFSSCLQSFPASGSFPMNQFFALGGQSFGASLYLLWIKIPVHNICYEILEHSYLLRISNFF